MRLIFIIFLFPLYLYAQPPGDRYSAEMFPAVQEVQQVLFSTAVPQPNPGGGFYEFISGYPLNVDEYDVSYINLYMDIFEPTGDTLSKRPLVIICFGGGFLSGSKDHWSIRLLCQDLAKRGFVTAAIDYRLGMNVFDSDLSQRAVYRGVQDARSAVRFFRADAAVANTYRIDPDQIFLGGHSSGAFMALHNAYMEKETERPLSTYMWTQDGQNVPDQLCLDCVGGNQEFSGHANSIFSLAGALGFTSFIETPNDPKVIMFHSTDDSTVPYDSGEPFSSSLLLVVGSDLPPVYGSLPISQKAASIGLPYEFFSYTNREHEVHENGSTALYDDIVPGISDWFLSEELKPVYNIIRGDQIVCSASLRQTYHLVEGDGVYFDWQIDGGTFFDMHPSSHEVIVDWDSSATGRKLAVIPYSALDAKGDSLFLQIEVYENGTNTYLATDSLWNNPSNWSLNHTPSFCEDVHLNNSIPPVVLSLSNESNINSIVVGENVSLVISDTGMLNIYQKSTTNSFFALDLQGEIVNSGIFQVMNKNIGKEIKVVSNGYIHNSGEIMIGKGNE